MGQSNEPEEGSDGAVESPNDEGVDGDAIGADAGTDTDPDDIEDEFGDFIDEEMGYADVDWDKIPQKQVDEHDRIRHLADDELNALDLRRANDLYKWAAARAHLEHGHHDEFEALAAKLLASKRHSKALDYVDIGLALMGHHAKRGEFDAAFAALDKLGQLDEADEGLVARFRGILTIQQGDVDGGLESLAQLAETRPDDAHFLLSLGEDLCGIGMWEPALEYLEIAEDLARRGSDNDLLSSIENAAQFAQHQIYADEVEADLDD